MNSFTIKDIENLTGVKAHTIRIWEQRYNFLKPSRTDTNIRYYSNEELKTILNISLLNKAGFKISHINKMNPDEIFNNIVRLSGPKEQNERIINQQIGYMIDFETEAFEKSLDNQLIKSGTDEVIEHIIFPFLERVGILWTTNHVNPAQEHLVTNIIRQKLLVGIENTHVTFQNEEKALLFLPEGEHHEIGLLYVYYLLKKSGIRVMYLGADVPLSDIEQVVKFKSPTFLYTHLTSLASNFNMERFLQKINKHASNIPCYISGYVTMNYKKEIPENIHLKKSLEEVKQFILGHSYISPN